MNTDTLTKNVIGEALIKLHHFSQGFQHSTTVLTEYFRLQKFQRITMNNNILSAGVRKPSQPHPVSHQSPRGDERAHAVYAVQPVSVCLFCSEMLSVQWGAGKAILKYLIISCQL